MSLVFGGPQINVYAEDVPRAVASYERLGFAETFRTPVEGAPIHVELVLDGRLRVAWVADPDGNPIELVQRRDQHVTRE